MGWELIGGDPAPGSPDVVGTSSAALRRVATIAAQARTDLIARTGAAGIQHWTGSAADAFRDDVGKLPADLELVSTSYSEAAAALDSFRGVLAGAQSDARAALALATQAAADRDAAVARHRDAQSHVEALTAQKVRAEASLLSLQTQQTVSLDPVHRAGLTAPITTQRSQVNRLGGDLASARQAAGRYQAQVDDANSRLQQAKQRADAIRRRLDQACNAAVDALKAAERDAHLPSWTREHLQRAGKWVTRNSEAIKDVLQVVQMICTVASMVFPVAAPVLMAVSLVCAALVLATDLVSDLNSPDGFKAANLWELGGDALGVIASAAGLGAMTKAMAASKGFGAVETSLQAGKDLNAARGLATVGKLAAGAQEAASVGQGYAEGGVTGAAFAVGTLVVGRGAQSAGGAAVRKVLADEKGSAAMRSQLSEMSLKLKADDPTPNLVGTPVDGLPNTSGIRSVLASGHQGLVGQEVGKDYAKDLASPLTDLEVDKAGDVLKEEWDRHTQPSHAVTAPDIDINLNPTPYESRP